MPSPTSPVAVCNLALDLLRYSSLITSLDTPESEEESLAARWYDPTRLAGLRMYPWNFARKRATLSRRAVAPAFGYADAYALPSDYVDYCFVGEDADEDYETDFVIEGRDLLIDNDGAAALPMCYIYNVEDVAKFDPIFTMLLAHELAVVFSNSLTGINKSQAAISKDRDRWEAKARAKNAQENPAIVRYKSHILTKRRSVRRSGQSDGQHLFS